MTPVYDRGGITIYHADCRDVLPHIDPASVALLLTDPPYGIGIVESGIADGRQPGNAAAPRHIFAPVANDDEPFDPRHLLVYGRAQILWGANHYADRLPPSGAWIVWDKRDGMPSNAFSDCELAWVSEGNSVRIFRHAWNGMLRGSERGYHVHPTQKPVALMAWILERWTKPGELILDPYMGSGPVAAAAYQLGRRYVGIELVREYVDVAIHRLAQEPLFTVA